MPIIGVLAYLILSRPFCNAIRSICGQETKIVDGKKVTMSEGFKANMKTFSTLHSALLAIYSGWTFFNTFGMVLSVTAARQAVNPGMGWVDAFYLTNCDHNAQMWQDIDFGTWVYHFYISKYWEFADTWIIFLKGGEPIFLQVSLEELYCYIGGCFMWCGALGSFDLLLSYHVISLASHITIILISTPKHTHLSLCRLSTTLASLS